jgi:hypothetical protein
LVEILKKDAFGKVFNAVNPNHPKKAEYYIQKAKELNLEPPTFAQADPNTVFKQVDSEHLKAVLDFVFKASI